MSHLITLSRSESILNAYFSRVYRLQAYLDTILARQDDTQVNDVLLCPTIRLHTLNSFPTPM
jgi:hypothetical protein